MGTVISYGISVTAISDSSGTYVQSDEMLGSACDVLTPPGYLRDRREKGGGEGGLLACHKYLGWIQLR